MCNVLSRIALLDFALFALLRCILDRSGKKKECTITQREVCAARAPALRVPSHPRVCQDHLARRLRKVELLWNIAFQNSRDTHVFLDIRVARYPDEVRWMWFPSISVPISTPREVLKKRGTSFPLSHSLKHSRRRRGADRSIGDASTSHWSNSTRVANASSWFVQK